MDILDSFTIVKELYKNDLGEPFEMTPSQVEIFDAVFYGILSTYSGKTYECTAPRVQIETYTQFGKSEIISMAVLTAVSTYPVKVALIGPTTVKAKIIMGYIIKHIFDHKSIMKKFDVGDESLEHVRRERSKNRLTFRLSQGEIGDVYIVSAEAKRKGEDAGNALMGFGAPSVIEDESALIPDPIHSKAMRMVGGHKRNFICKVGNPFKRNHFLRSHNDANYKKIIVDWQKGVQEGRLLGEYVLEMQNELFFNILYEVKFPESGQIDDHGWLPLLTDDEITRAQVEKGQHTMFGKKWMGWDVGRGINFSVGVLRSTNYASIIYKSQIRDTMSVAGEVVKAQAMYKVDWTEIAVDRVGVGAGMFDRLKEMSAFITGVSGADKPHDERFANLRAEMFWRVREWILTGGRLEKDAGWQQLGHIKYKSNSSGKMIIMSKEQMMLDGIDSPDIADALSISFFKPYTITRQGTIEDQIRIVNERRIKRTAVPSFR